MQDYTTFLEEIVAFKGDHGEKLPEVLKGFKNNYDEASKVVDLSVLDPQLFFQLKELLEDSVEKLSDLNSRSKKIKELIKDYERRFTRSCDIIQDGNVRKQLIKQVEENVERINEIMRNTNNTIIEEANKRSKNIADCAYGQAENKNENASNFERNVIELFCWLFIDEIRLLKNDEIKQKHLIRDGVFEIINDDFINNLRFRNFTPTHIIIECKNYAKPSYEDLMQVFAYTLLNRIYPIADNPLCLLVSRNKPSDDSITTKMRDQLFDEKSNKPLLVIFLDDGDLSEMVKRRQLGGKPATVLIEHLQKMLRCTFRES
jgi:hypothetical protein